MEREDGDLAERYKIEQANQLIAAIEAIIGRLYTKTSGGSIAELTRDFGEVVPPAVLARLPPFVFHQPRFGMPLIADIPMVNINSCTFKVNIYPLVSEEKSQEDQSNEDWQERQAAFAFSLTGDANDIGGTRGFAYDLSFHYFPHIDASNIAYFEELLEVEILCSLSDWEDVLVPVGDKLQFTKYFLQGLAEVDEDKIEAAPGCLSLLTGLLGRVIRR